MTRILITGAAGQIGIALRQGLRGSYPLIRLLDIAPLGAAEKGEEILAADSTRIAAMYLDLPGYGFVKMRKSHYFIDPE